MDLKQKANEFGFVSKIKLVHENLKSPDMGDLDKLLYYLWMCELQKWLREVHKINVESNYLPNVEKYKCLFIPMTLKKPSEYSTPGTAFTSRFNYLGKENYNTYEEALEIGLQEALKLS